ncbi:MAG: apolipoprotein N-acyltransferase [Myxococcota bacterium]
MNGEAGDDDRRRRRLAYAWAALGGVVYFLGWAGFGIWPLALVSLIPLLIALELCPKRPWSTAFKVSLVYGTVMIAGGYHWLIEFFVVFSGYGLGPSLFFWLAFSTFIGGQYAIYGLLYHAARRRGWSVVGSAIPPWLALEWLYPKLFPVYLANSFAQLPLTVQVADLGGPLLISFVAVLINVTLFELLRWARGQRTAPRAIVLSAVASIALTLGYGAVRIPQVEAAMAASPPLEVGIVQVNMGIFEKRQDAAEGHRRHLEQSLELESEGELDLLVWPESAYVRSLPRDLPFRGDRVRRDVRTPILFGGISRGVEDGEPRVYNTAFLMDGDGDVRASYDKTYLLMFGEYLPFGDVFPWLYDLSPNSGRFTAGDHVEPLEFGEWRLSTPVCYEDVLPDFTRAMVQEGNPHLLVNITNDAWFGDTQEPWIHLVLAQFRAVEHRRYLVRATNSGISSIVDPVGRIVARTGVMTRENLRAEVHMMDGSTVYTRLGNWPGWLALVGTVWLLIARRPSAK